MRYLMVTIAVLSLTLAGCSDDPGDTTARFEQSLSATADMDGYTITYEVTNTSNLTVQIKHVDGVWADLRILDDNQDLAWPPPTGALPVEPVTHAVAPGETLRLTDRWEGLIYPEFETQAGTYQITITSNIFTNDLPEPITVTWPPVPTTSG